MPERRTKGVLRSPRAALSWALVLLGKHWFRVYTATNKFEEELRFGKGKNLFVWLELLCFIKIINW